MGIDHREKMIIFSDSVNLDKALGLKKQCDEIGFQCKLTLYAVTYGLHLTAF